MIGERSTSTPADSETEVSRRDLLRSLPLGLTLGSGLGQTIGADVFGVERARAGPGDDTSVESPQGSFREISEFLDPVETKTSLRELSEDHRWASDEYQFSFRNMVRRHTTREREDQRFMFLNTFLMDWGKGDVIATKPLVGQRTVEIGQELLKRDIDIAALTEVWQNREKNWLLHELNPEKCEKWCATVHGVSKCRVRNCSPDTKPYHIDHITDKIGRTGDFDGIRGEENRTGSAGLLTLSNTFEFVDDEFEEYEFEDGSDRMADKGILMGTIDVGLGPSKLRIYNTHLQAAGERYERVKQILQLAAFIHKTKPDRDPALVAGDFNVNANGTYEHSTESVLSHTVCGHNCVSYHVTEYIDVPEIVQRAVWEKVENGEPTGEHVAKKTEHEILTHIFDALGFRDLWVERNGSRGFTKDVHEPVIGEKICKEAPDDDDMCKDVTVEDDDDLEVGDDDHKSDRVDYIFVSEPSPEQSFRIDFTRPRRPRTTRPPGAEGKDNIAWLSDHLGLQTTIRVVPT